MLPKRAERPAVPVRKARTVLVAVALAFAVAGGITPAWPTQDGVASVPPDVSTPKKPALDGAKASDELKKLRIQSPLVTAPVTVLDASGEFVYGLEKDDFQIFDNGAPQRVERFEVESRPVAAVIVVQTNRAVAPLLDSVRSLGPVFSTLLLGKEGRAAVVSFDDRVRVAQDFSNDDGRLASTLGDLAARGDNARLNDALLRAIEMLERRPREERRVIIGFADGFDHGSETQQDEVVQRSTGAEVTIYGLGFSAVKKLITKQPELPRADPLETNVTRPLPPGVTPTPTASQNVYSTPIPAVPIVVATGEIIRSTFASSPLEYYAGYTGGAFYSHWSKNAVEEQLSRIASEIHSQYELAYVPSTFGQGGFHRIEVQVRRPATKVRTRAGYFHPLSSTPSPRP